MRYKTMRKPSQQKTAGLAGLDEAAGRMLNGQRIRPLTAIALLTWAVVQSQAIELREPGGIQPQATTPDVQITQVKALPALGGAATTDVEIRWTAQVPRFITLDDFDVLLDVRYSDGSRGAAQSQQLKPFARAAILKVATHPRQNGSAIVKDFKATVKVRFRTTSSFAVLQQVTRPDDSVRTSAGSSSASRPEVFITAAKLIAQGCPSGQQCVDVRWTAAAPHNITISEFVASIEALHKDGTQTTDSKTVSGQDRQTRLQAGPSGVDISSMKVSVLTSFSLLDSKSAVKEGSFSDR
jgi:hypothetical protein